MSNADEITGATNNGSQDDSQNPNGTQPGTNQPLADTTDNSPSTPQDVNPLEIENKRLKGQISSVQKKYLEAVRNGSKTNTTQNGEQGESVQQFNAAFNLAEASLRNELEASVFPLYDGSDPTYKDQPALEPAEMARIRKNPWVFASRESFVHALQTGDLKPALLDIEQAIADRVDAMASSRTVAPRPGGKQVNPSPAPVTAPAGPAKQDLWSMPMEELETLKNKQV
jgi:hypothetical protein